MRTLARCLLLVASLAASSFLATARAEAPAPNVAPESPAERVLAERRAWATRVRDLRAAERDDLARRAAELRALPPGPARADAQRELEVAKRDWRRRMLAAQAERAAAAGQDAHASRLRTRLAELDALDARAHAPARPGGAR